MAGDFILGRSIVTCAKVGQMRQRARRLCSKITVLECNKKTTFSVVVTSPLICMI